MTQANESKGGGSERSPDPGTSSSTENAGQNTGNEAQGGERGNAEERGNRGGDVGSGPGAPGGGQQKPW